MTKKQWFYLIVILQVVFLLVMVAFKQSTLIYGTPVLLKPIPVDPTDMIRGDYINLNYEVATLPAILAGTEDIRREDRVYVQLENKGKYWEAMRLSKQKLQEPYLKGRVMDVFTKNTFTIREETSGKEYVYEERVYENAYMPETRNFLKGDRVQFNTFNADQVAYIEKCVDGTCPMIKDKFNTFQYGIITKIVPDEKEYSISYPIQSYFVQKGSGNRPELLNMINILVEVKVWRGDAIVSKILYDTVPIEFQ